MKFMVDFANPGRMELYDLSEDPSETKNLIPLANQEQDEFVRNFMKQITLEMQRINLVLKELLKQINNTIVRKKE